MIIYWEDSAELTAAQLMGGFFVGWPNPPSTEKHLELLQNSYACILALDDTSNEVVGFVNAVSDGVLTAYIPLLEVLPAYQKQGIGAALMERIIAKLSHLYMIDLLCDVELQSFYSQFAMRPATGMLIRNYENQAG